VTVLRYPKIATVTLAGALLSCVGAHGTEPDTKAVQCLSRVLRDAPNAVSVEPANDWIAFVSSLRTVRRGVEFRFRKPDGTAQTVGVYIGTEIELRTPDYSDPHTVPMAESGVLVPADNGRFALVLRPPFPPEWYPPALEKHMTPNSVEYVRQDSKTHPLFGLWGRLDIECRIDNLELNSPVTP
jgi:hypothetical protein